MDVVWAPHLVFALISYIRSHTGDQVFLSFWMRDDLKTCLECDTRSDVLAKHMRLQHNLSPPAGLV